MAACRAVSGPEFSLQPYRRSDRARVFQLLLALPSLYPGASDWLDRRLEDTLSRKAICRLAFDKQQPVGISIETPKAKRRTKLSTLYVAPRYRGLGVATGLMAAMQWRWHLDDIERADLTVDTCRAHQFLPLLERFGFKPMTIERDRYGEGRDELIVSWIRRADESNIIDVPSTEARGVGVQRLQAVRVPANTCECPFR